MLVRLIKMLVGNVRHEALITIFLMAHTIKTKIITWFTALHIHCALTPSHLDYIVSL